jgi:hypothetical protein
MNLSSPITITPPSFTRKDGTVRSFNPIALHELDITIIDNSKRKSAVVQIRPCPRPLVLWTGDAYTSAGDYTQAQVEARVLELLGENPSEVLSNLFIHPRHN